MGSDFAIHLSASLDEFHRFHFHSFGQCLGFIDALLRGNIKDRYAVYVSGIQGGVLKINEARQLENLPPVVGGDQLMVQAQMTPITQLGRPAAPTGAA